MSVPVCPICDKKMKYNHFCTNCKTYIKKPFLWERTYNLNGEGEETTRINQCENHDHREENATGKVRTDYKASAHKDLAAKRRQEHKRAEEMHRIEKQRREQQENYQRESNKNQGRSLEKKPRNIVLIILFVYILIQVLIPVIAGFFSLLF